MQAASLLDSLDAGARAAAPSSAASAGNTLGSGARGKAPMLTPAELRIKAAQAASDRAAALARTSAARPSSGAGDGGASGRAHSESRRLADDFGEEEEEEAQLKAALAASLLEAAPAQMPVVSAAVAGRRGTAGLTTHKSPREPRVATREIGKGKIEIIDEDDEEEASPVIELQESQDMDADPVIEIQSQVAEDSFSDDELQAALAASLRDDAAAPHTMAVSSCVSLSCSTSAAAAADSASAYSSRAVRQPPGGIPSRGKHKASPAPKGVSSSVLMSRLAGGARGAEEHARILVDTTERKRNADPREICRRLAAVVERSSPAARVGGAASGKTLLTQRDVEQKRLVVGDFTAVMVEEHGEENEEQEQERVLVVVERKTIADLCGRSLKGDHLRQVSKLRGCGVPGFLLLEGETKHAKNCSVWGLSPDQDVGKAGGGSVVQDDEHCKELLAWLVLTDKSLGGLGPGTVRVLQTKDLEQTLALLSALSMCAACEAQGGSLGRLHAAGGWHDDTAPLLIGQVQKAVAQVTKASKALSKTLESRDVPARAAAQMTERFGNIATVEAMLDSCKSDYHRSKVLDVADLSECRGAAGRAILQLLAPAAARVDDTDDDVVDLTMPAARRGGNRQCHIEASAGMLKMLVRGEEDQTELRQCRWLEIKEYSGAREVPALWMTARCCSKGGAGGAHRESVAVRLTVVKGPAVIEALLKAARGASSTSTNSNFSWQFQAAAAAAASVLERECDSLEDVEGAPRILVLEGIERARIAEEKKNGTAARELRDLRLLCDMLVSCLLLGHPSLTVWRSTNQDDSRSYVFALARVARTQALLVA